VTRPRRLSDHSLDLMTGAVQSLKRRYGELGRAGESDLQESA
jgi:hypothetical protein